MNNDREKFKMKGAIGMALYPKYQKMMDSGMYESIEEMCNQLCLNYDDVFDYADMDEEEDDD